MPSGRAIAVCPRTPPVVAARGAREGKVEESAPGKKVRCAIRRPVAASAKTTARLPDFIRLSAAFPSVGRGISTAWKRRNECYIASQPGLRESRRVNACTETLIWRRPGRTGGGGSFVNTTRLQDLVEALRMELQQYGEMLALLDYQEDLINLRGADAIFASMTALGAQDDAIRRARQTRQEIQGNFAGSAGYDAGATFTKLLPVIPPPYHGLIAALVEENNQLLQRVRQSAERNRNMLRESLEYMQRFVSAWAGADQPIRSTGESHDLIPVQTGSAFYESIA